MIYLQGTVELLFLEEMPAMCCRYYMELSPELRPFIEAANRSPLTGKMTDRLGRPLITSGEIHPTDIAPVVAPDRNGRKAVFPMVWGFTGKTSAIFNARVETADQKPMFRDAWERRRCIIPASWYYEWQHFKTPDGKQKTGNRFLFQTEGSSLTLLAGLYTIEEEADGSRFPHFTILTRESVPDLLPIHNRMPLVLDEENAEAWIRPDQPAVRIREIADHAVTRFVFEPIQAGSLF